MLRRFVLFGLCFITFPVIAQGNSLTIECQEAVRASEARRESKIYDACGFDDEKKAFGEWSLWAEKEKAAQAMYEICIRHQNNPLANRYCQKAAQLENGPALLFFANQSFAAKNYQEAASFYTRALSSKLLTEVEKGDIAQKMGLLYLNPNSSYYNPSKGLPLIEKAANHRGAEANNLMGVYALFGMQGIPQNAEESFKYLWRAVLLGCPAAEENLGLWHLARQKKIDNKTALNEMEKRMFSCAATDYVPPEVLPKHNCDCPQVRQREQTAALYPYRLTAISEDKKTITLLNPQKQEITAGIGTRLPDGTKVTEIGNKGAILTGTKRITLNLAPVDDCPQLCQRQRDLSSIRAKTIKPYRLSFTPQECSDILYYAEQLVDTTLPFTGKKECRFSGDMDKTADLLMNL